MGCRRLTRVTEPAGRYLQFSYATAERADGFLRLRNTLTASPGGQCSIITLIPAMLDRVSIMVNPNWTASYQYCAPDNANIRPTVCRRCSGPVMIRCTQGR